MKSFKNYFNGHKFLPSLQNISFESPSRTSNLFIYYNNPNQNQKNSIIWIGGGNAIDNSGPVFSNGNFAWGFQLPFPNGSQCIALQSTSFIQQSIYLIPGNYTISLYYISRFTAFANQIQILLDDNIIGSFCNIGVNTWILFSTSFTISNNSIVVLKFLGT